MTVPADYYNTCSYTELPQTHKDQMRDGTLDLSDFMKKVIAGNSEAKSSHDLLQDRFREAGDNLSTLEKNLFNRIFPRRTGVESSSRRRTSTTSSRSSGRGRGRSLSSRNSSRSRGQSIVDAFDAAIASSAAASAKPAASVTSVFDESKPAHVEIRRFVDYVNSEERSDDETLNHIKGTDAFSRLDSMVHPGEGKATSGGKRRPSMDSLVDSLKEIVKDRLNVRENNRGYLNVPESKKFLPSEFNVEGNPFRDFAKFPAEEIAKFEQMSALTEAAGSGGGFAYSQTRGRAAAAVQVELFEADVEAEEAKAACAAGRGSEGLLRDEELGLLAGGEGIDTAIESLAELSSERFNEEDAEKLLARGFFIRIQGAPIRISVDPRIIDTIKAQEDGHSCTKVIQRAQEAGDLRDFLKRIGVAKNKELYEMRIVKKSDFRLGAKPSTEEDFLQLHFTGIFNHSTKMRDAWKRL